MLNLLKIVVERILFLLAKMLVIFEVFYGKKGTIFLKENIEKKLNMTLSNDGIVFDVSHKGLYYRASTLLTKEPDTIEWINNFFKPGEVFFDIGANIGMFSLYAAKKRNVNVYAFEAESFNYSYLNKNIYLNALDENIIALNVAINDVNIISKLNLSSMSVGAALHNFHDEVNQEHEKFEPEFKQGLLGLSLDYIVENLNIDIPNHIKIDVDGSEYKIIQGAKKLLSDINLRTICIEINPRLELDLEVVNILNECGFSLLKGEKYLNKECVKNKQPYNMFFVRE